MFANSSNLKSVVLPESATEIPVGAFSNSGLTEITIPDAVQYSYSSAFYNCQSLATVRMSKNIVNVHESAFYECSIQDYYLSNKVVTKSIVSGVNATAIHFTDGVKEISSETFYSNKTITEKVLDEVIFIKNGSVMLHENTETLREREGKSVDLVFREVFKC